ncbi:DNA-methyltransferase [Nonomuraea sp. SYSU D8015]|uniref:DNA-methyltransferase n=1 Tax=Nonomuraea sp. SYSU D8015 TaxID=2593644 RepID=UPI0016612342|nr:site-specific DNA-methyltransferase [Nonomuraea sp. SYSU D8015]
MTVTIIRGDARALPLPDNSVDLICTSPPYWGLRDYRDGDQSLPGQIGNEPTPWEYLEALWECTREWMRVLKPEGSLFVVLGDKYATRWSSRSEGAGLHHSRGRDARGGRNTTGVPGKSLIGLPWRYALGCVDQLELILRAEIVWEKVSALPESVTDRVRRAHEQIFHFTSRPRYYSAVDEIREPHRMKPQRRPNGHKQRQQLGVLPAQTYSTSQRDEVGVDGHPLGALPGSVWNVAAQPLKVPEHLGVDHYAAFPMEFPRRIIRGWSPPGICTACGEGRRPVADRKPMIWRESPTIAGRTNGRSYKPASGTMLAPAETRITGYACACPTPDAPTRPAVIVDPFGGTGTTALIADLYGRHGISVDRSLDYCRIAQWRTQDPGERARGLKQPKPKPDPRQHEDQPALWDDEAIA